MFSVVEIIAMTRLDLLAESILVEKIFLKDLKLLLVQLSTHSVLYEMLKKNIKLELSSFLD